MLVALSLVAAPAAYAQTYTSTDAYVLPAEGAVTISWYGWETLSFDATFGAALLAAAVVLANQRQSDYWLAPIALPYVVATPIAHGVHDNVTSALISASLRLALPTATYAIIRASCTGAFCRDSSTGTEVLLWSGLLVSLVLTPLIDAALLAWERR